MEKKKSRILIVEDERIVAEDIEKSLSALGYEIAGIAASGEEAVQLTRKTHPDLILMDIVLRGKMNGIHTAETIYRDYNIPVVYLTAYADEETLDRAKRTEPYGYILKPFDDRELQTTIEMAIYKHRMEQRIKQNEAWLSTTLKSIGDAVITADTQGLVTFINSAAEKLTGWNGKDAMGKPLNRVFRIENEITGKAVESPMEKVLKHGVVVRLSEGTQLVDKQGAKIPIDDSAAPIVDEHGNNVGVVLVFQDVTQRKQMEKEKERMENQLLQVQKMEAIGRLTGGVAHDFNNLLTAIQGCTDMALMKTDESNPIFQDLREVQKAAVRAADLTRQLLLFSSRHPIRFSVVNLNKIVDDLLKMIHRLIGEDLGISTSLDSELWSVRADKGTIEQVIMNLAVNARDAMPRGGKITIRTENVHIQEDDAHVAPESKSGQFVRLTVSDIGEGMRPETLEHIFEPFCSTKAPGKGTGLGLSVVYGIIRQHHGWIQVRSEIHVGTTFEIYMPAVMEKAKDVSDENGATAGLQGNGERILIVEDAEGVQKFLQTALVENKYKVFAVTTAKEAMTLFEKEKGRFDLIFSDVVLPDKSGIDLIERMLKRNPKLNVLLSSGYTDHKSQWPKIQQRKFHYLQKPYSLQTLLKTVHDMLHKK